MDSRSGQHVSSVPYWTDSSLKRVEMDYDAIRLTIEHESGHVDVLTCSGYIGFELIGFWDEIIISMATLLDKHAFIDRCERRIENQPGSGSPYRKPMGNRLLAIELIDGNVLNICASTFELLRTQ